MKVTYNVILDVSVQGVQVTVPITQHDAGSHRLRARLRNGSEEVCLGGQTQAVLHVPDGDIWDPVTVYTQNSADPNSLCYDISAAVSAKEGMRRAVFQILDEDGGILYSPELAFSVRADLTAGSAVLSSAPYAAVFQAQTAAQTAAQRAETLLEEAQTVLTESDEKTRLVGDVLGDLPLATEAQTVCGAVNELRREAASEHLRLQRKDDALQARVKNLETASEGRLYVSASLTGNSVVLTDSEAMLPYLMVTKLGDVENTMEEGEPYVLPASVGPLRIPEEFGTRYAHLCKGRSYFDLSACKHVRFSSQRYTITGQENSWGEPSSAELLNYYVYLPSLQGLESGRELSAEGAVEAFLLGPPIHESNGNVFFPIRMADADAFLESLAGTVLIYGSDEQIVTDIDVPFEPYLHRDELDGEGIASDNGVPFELTYLTSIT